MTFFIASWEVSLAEHIVMLLCQVCYTSWVVGGKPGTCLAHQGNKGDIDHRCQPKPESGSDIMAASYTSINDV